MPRKPGAGNPYTKPRKTRSRVKPALPQGSTKPLDLIRNYNVERFQPDIYSGQTEHLAVVLRVESLTERSVTSARSNHMDDAELDTNLIVVRARIVDSDMHAYMPTPMGDGDHQIIDLYPAFEMATNTPIPKLQPAPNDIIRVQFYDRENSSLRNANGQILAIETVKPANYQDPPAGGSKAPPGPGGKAAELAKEKKRLLEEVVNVRDIAEKTEKGKHYDRPGWPIKTPFWDISDYQGSPRSHGTHAGIDIRTLNGSQEPVNGKEVLAILDGVVRNAGFQVNKATGKPAGGGARVYIEHPEYGGVFSWYMHISKHLVKAGDKVKRGTTIALSGGGTFNQANMNGGSYAAPVQADGDPPTYEQVQKYRGTKEGTGPHLHFEVRAANNASKSIPDILSWMGDFHEKKA